MDPAQMFLCEWPRHPFAMGGMPDDTVVKQAVATIVRYENPAFAVPRPLPVEYHEQLVKATLHMMHAVVLEVHEVRGETLQNAHLRNLRHWAYRQAGQEASDLLAGWCSRRGIEVPVNDPEHAIMLVRGIRAADQLASTADGNLGLRLMIVVQECATYLNITIDGPAGSAAAEARSQIKQEVWQNDPWAAFFEWLGDNLPIR